jgi:hypothetical protein
VECPAKFQAMMIDRAGTFSGDAATLGSCLHSVLEEFVNPVDMAVGNWDWDKMEFLWFSAWLKFFPGQPPRGDIWDDGLKILQGWFNRTGMLQDIQEGVVVSREIKHFFPVPYLYEGEKGEVNFNYIIDRLDQIDDTTWRVVDYKSQRIPWSAEEMRKKLQVLLYALAVKIAHPEATKIWVQFDFLRSGTVSVLFEYDDLVDAWRLVKTLLQQVVDTDVDATPERLNENCGYCVRKLRCITLLKHRVHGILGMSEDDLAAAYLDLKDSIKALGILKEEIENSFLVKAAAEDILDWYTEEGMLIKVTAPSRRSINRDRMSDILGKELMTKYGRINVGDLDTLRADPALTFEQKSLLNSAIEMKQGELGISIKRK